MSLSVSLNKNALCCTNPKQQVPFLCSDTICEFYFVEFVPVYCEADVAGVNGFIEVLELLCDDFTELLRLNFAQFWCQLLYSESLRACLDSFLSRAPRAGIICIPARARTAYKQLVSLIFAVFIRASLPRESELDFFSPKVFAELLYEYSVFDIPRMIDLCAVFHGLAEPHLISILSNVFVHQEKYLDDLKVVFQTLFEIFNRVESEVLSISSELDRLSDVTAYLFDISWSLYCFLSIVSKLTTRRPVDTCFESVDLEKFAAFFDRAFSCLQSQIEASFQLSNSQRQKLFCDLSDAGAFFVRAIRKGLLEPCLLDRIQQVCSETPIPSARSADHSATSLAHLYMDQTLRLLSYRKFSLAMQLLYPFEKDVLLLRQLLKADVLDDATSEYLLGAIECLLSDAGLHSVHDNLPQGRELQTRTAHTRMQPMEPVSGPSIIGSVREVKEVLPHMDVGLIQRCLDEFCGDSGRVINAALEGNIPEHIMNANEPAQVILPHRSPSRSWNPCKSEYMELDLATAAATGVVSIQPNQVWQGKRETSLTDLGKREKRVTLRSAFSIWENEEDDNRVGSELADGMSLASKSHFGDVYEDEYDDSYDVREGTVAEVISVEEPGPHRSTVGTSSDAYKGKPFSSTVADACQAYRSERMMAYQPPCVVTQIGRNSNVHPSAIVSCSTTVSSNLIEFDGNSSTSMSSANDQKADRDPKSGVSAKDNHHYRGVHKARFGNHNRRRLADRKHQL